MEHAGDDPVDRHTAGPVPPRTPWRLDFPLVVVHTALALRDGHPLYTAAKSGGEDAALALSQDLLSASATAALRQLHEADGAALIPITALEMTGFNAIPDAMAQVLGRELGWPVSSGLIVQNNKVGHTRAPSFNRLVTPAAFEGEVTVGERYVLIDDHVGLGGTLTNLKGHIETNGGRVVAMTTITESRDARHIALRPETLAMIRVKHGEALENLWQDSFGHGLECLTELEGQILCREQTVDTIRGRLAQAAIEAHGRGLEPAAGVAD